MSRITQRMVFGRFALALLLVGAGSVLAADDSGDSSSYRIGAGDRLEISVWKNDQLSRTVTVRPDGKISLPLVNDIEAAGVTPMQLRDYLAKKLGEYVPMAEVSVIVSDVRSFNVSVIGAVSKPGYFSLRTPTTVLDALAKAGGLTEFASRKSIAVLRIEDGKTRRIPFNYDRVIGSEDKADANFFLHPGDVVVVP